MQLNIGMMYKNAGKLLFRFLNPVLPEQTLSGLYRFQNGVRGMKLAHGYKPDRSVRPSGSERRIRDRFLYSGKIILYAHNG